MHGVHLKLINNIYMKNIQVNLKNVTILVLKKNNEYLFCLNKNIIEYKY